MFTGLYDFSYPFFIVIFFVYTLLKYIRNMETIVRLQMTKPEYNRLENEGIYGDTTQTITVSSDNDNMDELVDMVFEQIRLNYEFPTNIDLTVQNIYDTTQLDDFVNKLGHRNIQFVPFVVNIGGELEVPKSYDPIWV